MAEYPRGAGRKPAPVCRHTATRPADGPAAVSAGRIVKLLVGQGYGYIRLRNNREVFFHRSDIREGTSVNDLAIGDYVTFELVEDAISGARAVHVEPRRRRD